MGRGLHAGLLLLAILAPPAVAQPASAGASGTLAELSAARRAAERAHLQRVGAWGALNLAAGGVVLAATRRADVRAAGLQAALWGGINGAIAVAGLVGAPGETLASAADVWRAEDRLAHVLLVNVGLNVGYVMVGATLVAVASRGVAQPAVWRAHGGAVMVQGLALLALDGVAYAGSRERLGALIEAVAVVPTLDGVSLVVRL